MSPESCENPPAEHGYRKQVREHPDMWEQMHSLSVEGKRCQSAFLKLNAWPEKTMRGNVLASEPEDPSLSSRIHGRREDTLPWPMHVCQDLPPNTYEVGNNV